MKIKLDLVGIYGQVLIGLDINCCFFRSKSNREIGKIEHSAPPFPSSDLPKCLSRKVKYKLYI